MESPLSPDNEASTSVVQNVIEPPLLDSDSSAKSDSSNSETSDDSDQDDNARTVKRQQFFKVLDTYRQWRMTADANNVIERPLYYDDSEDNDDSDDSDDSDDDAPMTGNNIGLLINHENQLVAEIVQRSTQSPIVQITDDTRRTEFENIFPRPINGDARPQFHTITISSRNQLDDLPIAPRHAFLDESELNRLAICKAMESPWLIGSGEGAVEVQNIIAMHLTSDCNCSEQLPPHISRAFELFAAHVPPETLNMLATLEYLSIVRLLLSKFRSQTRHILSGRCPALNIACRFLMLEPEWKERILVQLSSEDKYVEHEAIFVATEFILGLAFDGRRLAVDQCFDDLFRIIRENRKPLRTGAAMDVLRHVLEVTDNQMNNLKRGLLVKMQRQWKSIVMQWPSIRYNSVSRLLDLYLAVFQTLQLRECQTVYNLRKRYINYLSKVKPLLAYGNPDRPHIYLKTVRLLGYALSVDTISVPYRCRGTHALTKHILEVFKDGSMLFSLRSVSQNLVWPENYTVALQDAVMLALRTLRVYVNTENSVHRTKKVISVVQLLNAHVKLLGMYGEDVPFYRWLVRLMFQRDDAIAECLRCIIDLSNVNSKIYKLFQPFINFIELLACTSYNESLFIDYLISTETQFLMYLLQILRKIYIHSNRFFKKCGDELPKVMGFLSRFREKLGGSEFPYNIKPLKNVIQLCEDLHSKWKPKKSNRS